MESELTPARRAEIEATLAEVEGRERAATPGPWRELNGYTVFAAHGCLAELSRTEHDPDDPESRPDGFPDWDEAEVTATFIAAARTDVPRLVAIVRELLAREALGPDLTMTIECSTCEGTGTEIVKTEDRGRAGILCLACTGTGRAP